MSPAVHSRLSRLLAFLAASVALLSGCGGGSGSTPKPVVPADLSSFVDPTVALGNAVVLGREVYIAPFARVGLGGGEVVTSEGCSIQDNATLEATYPARVSLGRDVTVAHGATVVGPARLGSEGGLPCYVGFNAKVERADLEADSMLGPLAHLAPGLVLHAGRKVLPGRDVLTQAEADDPSLGKVALLTDADRSAMRQEIQVNRALARSYVLLASQGVSQVLGVSVNPVTAFQAPSVSPKLAGSAVQDGGFRNRIVGAVVMGDPLSALGVLMGSRDSIRGDEGAPIELAGVASMGSRVTLHAAQGTRLQVGAQLQVGEHVVIHGGEAPANPDPSLTSLGSNVQLGDHVVLFRSVVGNGCVVGSGAVIDGCLLPDSTVVPPRTILINNVNQGAVTWTL